MKKKILSIAVCLTLGGFANAQNVNIPDLNFKNALLAHGASASVNGLLPITGAGISQIDTNGDGEIQVTEAQAYSGTINLESSGAISSIQGIHHFTALTELKCSNNQLNSVNLSSNTALRVLDCSYNNLDVLNLTQNTSLEELFCYNNSLTILDISQNTALTKLICSYNPLDTLGLSQFTALTILSCRSNNITSLDVSQNTALTSLDCTGNNITSLDVSQNTALTQLYCRSNNITSLDVNQNTALTMLDCTGNNITSLDVSQNTALTQLYCRSNNITSLDVSQNTALTRLICNYNSLTSLNVANGNNGVSSTNLNEVNATSNPNLTCIQHDTSFDPSNYGYWQKDATASWSENCSGGGTSSINENTISFSIVPNPTNGMVKIETDVAVNKVEVFSMTGQKIHSSTEKTIDLSDVKSGVYFVKVSSENGMLTRKLIKN